MKNVILLSSVFLLVTTTLASVETLQSAQPIPSTYVPNEIIVKFKKPISDIIEDGISVGKQLRDLKLSDSLE